MVYTADKLENILTRLDKYPNIKACFKPEWISREHRKGVRNAMMWLLSYDNPPEAEVERMCSELEKAVNPVERACRISQLSNTNFHESTLKRIDICLGKLIGKPRLKDMIIAMKANENGFWTTLSELEVAAHFSRLDGFAINPRIYAEKNTDSVFFAGDRAVYTEVTTPDIYSELKQKGVCGVPNRIPNIALDKYNQHFGLAIKSGTIRSDSAFVLVINAGYSEIDFLNLEDALYGTSAVGMLFDKTSGSCVEMFPTREKDSINDREPDLGWISAILMYKREKIVLGGFVIVGQLLSNPLAKNPLTKQEIAEFNKLFVPHREPSYLKADY